MTRYKQSNINWKRVWEHVKVMCEFMWITEIPKWFVVHHIDENKHNNNIDNLLLVSFKEHNTIHKHNVWNKWLNVNTNLKWRKTIDKIQESRNKYYLPILKEYYDLKMSWVSIINIGKKFNKSRATIYSWIKKYETIIEGGAWNIRE